MNVLAIGNSFSVDSTRYLHQIARADGVNLQVVSLHIGACSLERHYRNMLSEERAYALIYNGSPTGFKVSMKEALLNRPWDVVTIQQCSPRSFEEAAYHPYIEELAAYIRKCSPAAKFYIHQTWMFEAGSEKLRQTGFSTPFEMLEGVVKTYGKVAELTHADEIIRSGEMFGSLLQNGIEKVHRDTFHASFGLGRYALGLLWYHTLCRRDVTGNTFCDFDEPISDAELKIIKQCVNEF